MNSTHFRNLFDTLSSTLVSVIKEKIDRYYIKPAETEKSISILNPANEKYGLPIKISKLSSDSIVLEDNTSIGWEEIKNFNDLLLILEYVEEWLKTKAKESIHIEWSIHDFEDRASAIESRKKGKRILFDRSKFSFALKILEHHHDYNNGICWDDVDYHLEEYCKLD